MKSSKQMKKLIKKSKLIKNRNTKKLRKSSQKGGLDPITLSKDDISNLEIYLRDSNNLFYFKKLESIPQPSPQSTIQYENPSYVEISGNNNENVNKISPMRLDNPNFLGLQFLDQSLSQFLESERGKNFFRFIIF